MRIVNLGMFHVTMNPNQSSIELVSPNSLNLRNIWVQSLDGTTVEPV